jgi:hypothetical protein
MPVIRLVIAVIATCVAYFVMLWLVTPLFFDAGIPARARILPSLVGAIGAGFLAWLLAGKLPQEAAAAMGTGALIGSAVGFIGGFIGPMLFSPDSNQGPLVGLFITGPLGVPLGGIVGLFVWYRSTKSPRKAVDR